VRVGRDLLCTLPQLVVVCSYCRWREEAVEMFDIVKQLVVGVFQQLIERPQVIAINSQYT